MRQKRTRALGDRRPDSQMQGDFRGPGRFIVGSQPEAPLKPEDQGQRRRDEKKVIKVTPHE
jgi:hypothetical protein